MNKTLQVFKYILSDVVASALAWTLFFVFRKSVIESLKYGVPVEIVFTDKYFTAFLLIPVFWILLFAITGSYRDIFRRSRLKELLHVLSVVFIGVIVLFFAVVLDDEIADYRNYYHSFLALLGLQFLFTALGRLILTSITAHYIHNRIYGFNTLIIGSNEKASELFDELENQKKSSGFKIVGYVYLNGGSNDLLKNKLKHLGHYNQIDEILNANAIEEVIIAVETSEHHKINRIINDLADRPVKIKVIPDMYDILSGSVKMNSIFGAALIEVNKEIMPQWEKNLKRGFDIVASIFAIIILLPLYFIIGLLVKLSSPGPILYSHERIGKSGRPFTMYKFRSMYQDAEKNGPALSSKNDSRITPLGKFLRQTRIDETPQFFNVIKGEMSIVGPRPERQFFINQILARAPHYKHLQKVKPGITSWGQVKFGYAENVDQMIERLKYDLLYIENMSLIVDFKILIYTVLIVLQGRGK